MPKKNNPGCTCCEEEGNTCFNCSVAGFGDVSVSISGYGYSGSGCDDTFSTTNCCTTANATYIVPFVGIGGTCAWTDITAHPTNGCFLEIRVTVEQVGSDYVLRVDLRQGCGLQPGNTHDVIYEKNFGTTKPDCSNWSNEAVTHSSTPNDSGKCTNLNGLTVTVTSV